MSGLFPRGTPVCERCLQLGVQCQGYGIRLQWVRYNPYDPDPYDEDHQPHTRTSRASRSSLAGLGLSVPPCLPSSELNLVLSKIDDWCPGEEVELGLGAFSVFSARPLGSLEFHPSVSPADIPFIKPSPLESYSNQPVQRSDSTHEKPSHPPDFHLTHSYTEIEGSVPVSRDQTHVQLSTYQGSVSSVVDVDTSFRADAVSNLPIFSDDVPVAHTLLSLGRNKDNLTVSKSPGSPRHLDALDIPAKQKRLIHHWITFTSRKIVLVDEPQNPCRTMMLPMALKGLVSGSTISNAGVAIFHAVCASAAYNLYELGGRSNEQDHVLALNHDQHAIYHLRHNLTGINLHQDQSVAMAIMACIVVEAISGTTERWRTHVSGGLAYLARLHSQGVDERILAAFRHHMVKMAILCDVSVPSDLNSFLHDDSSAGAEGLEFTFPYYGVSRSFLRSHDRIDRFAASHDMSETELDAFELQLYLDFPGLPPPDLACTMSASHGVVIHHIAKVFYYAQLVFFQYSIRRSPLDSVQALVELGVVELESIERVGRGELGCIMLWPALVLGAESGTPDLQRRVRAWFQSQRKLGFRNLVVLEALIAAVWQARADCGVDMNYVDWQSVIAQNPAQFDVFRL